jgi:hypothetical protein
MGHDDFSYNLAVGWYKQCFKEGRYNNDINKNCAVIFAVFNVNKDQFVNISTPIFDKIIREYKERLQIHKPKELAKLYDKIVTDIEKENGEKIYIFLTQVFAPKREYLEFESIDRAIGDPYCYVVRENSIIDIKDTKEYCDVRQ